MTKRRVSHGVRAGFCAAAALLIWFILVDVVRGQLLLTPAYLSGLLFSITTALPASARLLAFSVIVFAAFAAVGATVAVLLERLRLAPRWYLGIVVGGVVAAVVYLGSATLYGVDLLRGIGWMQLVAGNLVAGVVMLAFLNRKRA
jgi:hypothetical protein